MTKKTAENKSLKEKIFDIQNNIGAISKNSENPFFKSKYFDVNTLIAQLQVYLQANRLVLTQPIRDNKVYSIISDLDSDDEIESSIMLPELTDPQKIGSCITYYRRYTLASLLALQAEDDDGNHASEKQPDKKEDDKPWLKEKGPQFENALKAISEGKTIKDIRLVYKVSKKVEKLLTEN